MRFKRLIFPSLIFTAVITVFAPQAARTAALSETPAAVQKTIGVQVGDGVLGDIDQTNEDGETTFDVSFTTKSGDERDFSVADDGTLLSVEVGLDEAPAAVQKTISSQASGWELESIDKNVDDPDITYDIDVTKDGLEKEFTVSADGGLTSLGVSPTETPAAVQKTIQAQLAGGQLESVDEAFDADGNTFDVEAIAKDGTGKTFSVATNGIMFSEEVTLEQVAPAARKTIRDRIADGKILRIDKSMLEKTDGVLPYVVQGRKDGKPFDFSVGPHGRFLGMDN